MAISIRSSSIYNLSNNSNTCTITKPSNLAVGDLMVAQIMCNINPSISAPSGWNLHTTLSPFSNGACYFYRKIATATDVSATNFVWTSTNTGMGGIIYAVINGDYDNIQHSTSAVTPTKASNLALLYGISSDNDSDPCTWSGYAVTGGMSPTFTENIDSYGTYSTYYVSLGVASGIYSSAIAISGITVNAGATPDETSRGIFLIGESTPPIPQEYTKTKNTKLLLPLNNSAVDISGNGYNGTATSMTYGAGKLQSCGIFNGSTSKITTPNASIPTTDMTLSFWFKKNGNYAGNGEALFSTNSGGANWGYVVNGYLTGMGITWRKADGTVLGSVSLGTDLGSLVDNNWHHVVFTYNNTSKIPIVYKDGEYYGSGSALSESPVYTTNVFTIGDSEDTYWGNFSGSLDEIIVENKVWSAEEVRNYYNKDLSRTLRPLEQTKFIADANLVAYYKLEDTTDSKGGFTLTNHGTTPFNSAKFSNGADFGTGNTTKYLDVANNLGLTFGGAKTISCWVKLNAEIASGSYYFVEADTANRSSQILIRYNYNSGTRTLQFTRYSDTGSPAVNDDINFPIELGTTNWYFLTVKYDGTNMYGYLNGVLVGQIASSSAGTGTGGYSDAFRIATNGNGNQIVDDIGVFSRSLSDGEIAELYAGQTLGEFIPSTPALTGTELESITSLRNDANLTAYWRLESSSVDAKGSYTGTDTSMTYGTGRFGNGAIFSGSGYISTAVGSYHITDTEWTITFLFKTTGSNYCGLFFRGEGGETSQAGVGNNGGNGIRYVMRNGGDQSVDGDIKVNDGLWHRIVVTKTGTGSTGTIYIYVDGVLDASGTLTNLSNINYPNIMGRLGNSGGAYYLTGMMDDVAVFSRVLNSTEIAYLTIGTTAGTKLLYKLNGTSADSIGTNNGTDTDIYYTGVAGKFGLGARLNGISSHIKTLATGIYDGANATASIWVKINVAPASGVTQTILIAHDQTTHSFLNMEYKNDGGTLKVIMGRSRYNAGDDYITTTYTLTVGVWYNLIVTQVGTAIKAYVNGALLGSTTSTGNGSASPASETRIGSWIGNSNWTDGNADSLIIENGGWSTEKVWKYYSYAKGRFGNI